MASDEPAFTEGYDEARTSAGTPRPLYGELLGALERLDRGALRDRVAERLDASGVTFGNGADASPFVVDPVPRLLAAGEWDVLRAGLEQRVRALERFVRDVYGERRICAEGIVPEATIETAAGYEPDLLGSLPEHGPAIGVAGLDLVRGADGDFVVLEDNLRTPSGFAYAAAARDALNPEALPVSGERADFAAAAYAALDRTIRAATPPGGDPSHAVVLTDGAHNSAYFEHADVARRLGLPLVTPADLALVDGACARRDADGALQRVDVVYRRTDEDRLCDDDGRPTTVGELVGRPWQDGRLGLVNPFGTGVADDKATHTHVEEMIRYYLGEDPLLRSVPTLDLADPQRRQEALDRIDELVVKPRWGHGGHGVVVCAHADPQDVAEVARALQRHPERFVVQPTIALSLHPTVLEDGALAPRHVDLRPFAFSTGDEVVVPPGGLTRVAFGQDALVVNSSQQGGGKDTWVMT